MHCVASECIPSAIKHAYAWTIIFNYSVEVDGRLVVLRRVILPDLFELQPYTFKKHSSRIIRASLRMVLRKLSFPLEGYRNNFSLRNLEILSDR